MTWKFRFLVALTILVFVHRSEAQKGVFTTYSTTWNGFTRVYSIYVPPNLQQPSPAMVMVLHQTISSLQTQPPIQVCNLLLGWEKYADEFGFLLVCPVSTWIQHVGNWWHWDSYNADFTFPIVPDDSGFLRNLIEMISPLYNIDPTRVFCTGMSSGAMMCHRLAIDSSDLVAAIATVSSVVWISTNTLPTALGPVSVLEYHGDADPLLQYCGGTASAWGYMLLTAPTDDTLNYWLVQDSLGPNLTPLCTNGSATPGVNAAHFRGTTGVDVEFIRELGVAHTYNSALDDAIWVFFASHPKVQ